MSDKTIHFCVEYERTVEEIGKIRKWFEEMENIEIRYIGDTSSFEIYVKTEEDIDTFMLKWKLYCIN